MPSPTHLRKGCVGGVKGELFKVGELRDSRPGVFAGRPEQLEDALQFVVGIVPGEQGAAWKGKNGESKKDEIMWTKKMS